MTELEIGIGYISSIKYKNDIAEYTKKAFINSITLTSDHDQILFDDKIKKLLTRYFTEEEVEWLVTDNNLLFAPAAKKHHGNFYGGLFLHSMLVGLELITLTQNLDLIWEVKDSPMRIGLLHDICKTDDYIFVDNETVSDNTTKYMIEFNPEKLYNGHGEKSIIMLNGHVSINDQEKDCILYHMGAFTDKDEWPYYSRACKREPNVLYTHTADMIASQIRGI